MQATMDGNLIDYPDIVGTPTADLFHSKIIVNSIISTPGGHLANANILNFYLMTPLKHPEYANIKISTSWMKLLRNTSCMRRQCLTVGHM